MVRQQARDRLEQIHNALKSDPTEPQRYTVREILGWFGYRRRARLNRLDVSNAFRSKGLTTVPDVNAVHIDSTVLIKLKADSQKAIPTKATETATSAESDEDAGVDSGSPGDDSQPDDSADIANLVSRLRSANREVTSVSPSDTFDKAITTMLLNDYSQLPVMTTRTKVKGMISWQSIGQSLSQGVQPGRVQDCMTTNYREVRADSRLLDVVDEIVDNGAVLVVGSDSQLQGIITTADLSEEFKKLAEPFLQIGEIEQHLRNLLSHLDGVELQKFTDPSDEKSVGEISDLALGEIIRILQNKEVWETVDVNLDRKVLVNRLEEVREIRNQVMHFDPDGLDESQLELIRGVSKMLHELRELPRRQVGPVGSR